MQEGSKRLNEVLRSLVNEGALTAEQSALVDQRFEALDGSDSRKSIFAEIAAYLGGAFIIIAVIFLTAKSWSDAPTAVRAGALAIISLLLLAIAHFLGDKNPMRLRLTSVLSMGAAFSLTGAFVYLTNQDAAPWAPFSAGCVIALYSFIKYKHEILHIGAYGYLFLTGFMTLGRFFGAEPDHSPVYALYWVVLASIWLYIAWLRMVDQSLGYLIVAATYFLASQFLFGTDQRTISYIVSLIAIPVMAWIFLIDRRWPLLLGSVAMTTFTTGEFVAATLVGSLGALLGLLTAGIALISTSMLAIRRAS